MDVHFSQNVNESDENIPEMVARIQAVLNPQKWVAENYVRQQKKLDSLYRVIKKLKTQFINCDEGIAKFMDKRQSKKKTYIIR